MSSPAEARPTLGLVSLRDTHEVGISWISEIESPWADSFLDETEIVNQKRLRTACEAYMDARDMKKITIALGIMHYAHQAQMRDSGERYSNHCLRVATSLAEKHLDAATVAAGAMHDVLEDSAKYGFAITEDNVREIFSANGFEQEECEEIVTLMRGARNAEFDVTDEEMQALYPNFPTFAKEEKKKIYNQLTLEKIYRQFSGGPDTDPRILFIKLDDRLDNMRTIRGKKGITAEDAQQKQRRKAEETLRVFGNLAGLLGELDAKNELIDRSFELLYPGSYGMVVSTLTYRTQKPIVSSGDSHLDYQDVLKLFSEQYSLTPLEAHFQSLLPSEFQGQCRVFLQRPSLYELFQSWISDPDKIGRMLPKDNFLSTIIVVPDNVAQNNAVVERILSGFQKQMKLHPEWQFIVQIDGKKSYAQEKSSLVGTLRVRVTGQSVYQEEHAHVADLYRNTQDTTYAQKKLEKLRHIYQLIRTHHDAPDVVETLVTHMDGVRVTINGTAKPIVLPQHDANFLALAWLLYKENIAHLVSFSRNGNIHASHQGGEALQDGDHITLDFQEESDLTHVVTPAWLAACRDKEYLQFIGPTLRDRLKIFGDTNSPTYPQWKKTIQDIGKTEINRLSLYGSNGVGFRMIQPVIRKLGLKDVVQFLTNVAYGDITPVQCLEVAHARDMFLSQHLLMNVRLSPDHPAHVWIHELVEKTLPITYREYVEEETDVFLQYAFHTSKIGNSMEQFLSEFVQEVIQRKWFTGAYVLEPLLELLPFSHQEKQSEDDFFRITMEKIFEYMHIQIAQMAAYQDKGSGLTAAADKALILPQGQYERSRRKSSQRRRQKRYWY